MSEKIAFPNQNTACESPVVAADVPQDSQNATNDIRSNNTIDKKHAKKLDPTRYGDWEKNGRCIDF